MIDQDGVVLGPDYQTNADISTTIQASIDKGMVLVPNSDTPIDRLNRNFQSALGYEPKITIGEGGAVVRCLGETIPLCEVVGISDYIDGLIQAFRPTGCHMSLGDAPTWVREDKKFTPGKELLLVDRQRQHSIAFYLRKADDLPLSEGLAILNEEWFARGRAIAEALPLPTGLSPLVFDDRYGIAIASPTGISKRDGYRFLRDKFKVAQIYMIGDSNSDWIGDDGVTQCAVGNASDSYKQHCRFVADQEYTRGLAECLKWIALD